MPMTEQDLRARADKLRALIVDCRVPEARAALEAATAEHERCKPKAGLIGFLRTSADSEAAEKAAQGLAEARRQLSGAEFQAGPLQAELSRLAQMLSGRERIKTGADRVATTQAMHDTAAAAVTKAEATAATIRGLIADEEKAFEGSKSQAAAELLAAVKAGADAGAVAAPTRDRITTLEIAHVAAQEEAAAARAALEAARQGLEKARLAHAEAVADDAILAVEVATANYLDSVVECMRLVGEARRSWGPPDIRSMALERYRRAIGA